MLRRVDDPGLSSDAPTSTGVCVLAANLPHVHRGSLAPVPFDAIGEFAPPAAEMPSMFAPGGTHHRFNLHWDYQTEGNWFGLLLVCDFLQAHKNDVPSE